MGCTQSSIDPNTIKLKECNQIRYKKRQAELDDEIYCESLQTTRIRAKHARDEEYNKTKKFYNRKCKRVEHPIKHSYRIPHMGIYSFTFPFTPLLFI